MTQTQVTTDTFYSKMPTIEQMLTIITNCEASIKTSVDAENYRMENYYNCVDDYSWGGICSQAANENISRNRNLINSLNEQMVNGSFIEDEYIEVLCDLNGNIVSNKIINGKFGFSWVLNGGGFVSVSKKESTYEKKGYKVMMIHYRYEYYLTGGTTQKGQNSCVSRLISSEIMAKDEELCSWDKSWYLWCALNNQ